MAACDAKAAEKKLAGAAKTSFTKKCVADAKRQVALRPMPSLPRRLMPVRGGGWPPPRARTLCGVAQLAP